MPPKTSTIQFQKDPQTGNITKTEIIDQEEFNIYKSNLQAQFDEITLQIANEQSNAQAFADMEAEKIKDLQAQLQTVQTALTEAQKA